jgi:WD40 repeat protein
VSFSPDGLWLATASQDKTSKLWDVTSGLDVATRACKESCVRNAGWV